MKTESETKNLKGEKEKKSKKDDEKEVDTTEQLAEKSSDKKKKKEKKDLQDKQIVDKANTVESQCSSDKIEGSKEKNLEAGKQKKKKKKIKEKKLQEQAKSDSEGKEDREDDKEKSKDTKPMDMERKTMKDEGHEKQTSKDRQLEKLKPNLKEKKLDCCRNKDRKSKVLEQAEEEEETREKNMPSKSEGTEENQKNKGFKKMIVYEKSERKKSGLAEKKLEHSDGQENKENAKEDNFDVVWGKQKKREQVNGGKFPETDRRIAVVNPKYVHECHESQKMARQTDAGIYDKWKKFNKLKQTHKVADGKLTFINDSGTQINVWGNASQELLAKLDQFQQNTQVVLRSKCFFFCSSF